MNALVEREAIIILALVSAILFVVKHRWESVLTRAVMAGVYIYTLHGLAGENAMFLLRWSLILMLVSEVIFNAYTEIAARIKTKQGKVPHE